MKAPAMGTVLLALVALAAAAGWARAGDEEKDLAGRVRALEERLAALPATPLRARGLVIEDAEGRDRIVLGTTQHGAAHLKLLDSVDPLSRRAFLEIDGEGVRLVFHDKQGSRVRLLHDWEGDHTTLNLMCGPLGHRSAQLTAGEGRSVGLILFGGPGDANEAGKAHAAFTIQQDGRVGLGGGHRTTPGGQRSLHPEGFHLRAPVGGPIEFDAYRPEGRVLWRLPPPK